MPTLTTIWNLLRANKVRVIALLLLVVLLVPPPANAQIGFLTTLINLVSSGLGSLNNVMTSVNNTLRNVINAVQQIMNAIFDFQRNVVYPQAAINRAQALVGQVMGIYGNIRGIWATVVRSATLASPRSLETILLSKNPAQIGSVGASFSSVYTPLPPATEAHSWQRDLIDSSDAASQAAMKRAIAIDAIADQELEAAEQMLSALASTAPGTAEMIGAQAGAWLVRSNAYTQQAMAELMRLRAVELAGQGARVKEAARFTRETRNKLTEMNRR
jgi:hypothetical protein